MKLLKSSLCLYEQLPGFYQLVYSQGATHSCRANTSEMQLECYVILIILYTSFVKNLGTSDRPLAKQCLGKNLKTYVMKFIEYFCCFLNVCTHMREAERDWFPQRMWWIGPRCGVKWANPVFSCAYVNSGLNFPKHEWLHFIFFSFLLCNSSCHGSFLRKQFRTCFARFYCSNVSSKFENNINSA